LKCWTRREAYLKARGEGLSERDGRFDVLITPQEHPAVFSIERGLEEALQWSLKEIVDELGYVASLAVEGGTWTMKRCPWLQSK
jgi:4'-phosphopantetheinyl transferase